MDIYIRRGEEQFGPLTPEQLQEGLNNGTLLADDLAWHGELPDWISAGEMVQAVSREASGESPLPEQGKAAASDPTPVSAPSGVKKKLISGVAAFVFLFGGGAAAAFFAGVFGGGEETPEPANPPIMTGAGGGTGGGENTGGTGGTVNPPVPVPLPAGGEGTTSFAAVTQKLDSGGSFYFYLSTDQAQRWVQTAFTEGGKLLNQLGGGLGGNAAEAETALNAGKAVYTGLGLDSVDGLGASTKDLGDGLKRNVAVLHRDAAQGDGLLWKTFGTAPHEIGALKLMPAETAYAAHGDLDVNEALKWVHQLVTQHAPPEVAAQLTSELQNPMLQAVLGGYGGEIGVYLTLDPQKTIPVPLGGSAVGGPAVPEVFEFEPDGKEDTVPAPPGGIRLPEAVPVPGLPQPPVPVPQVPGTPGGVLPPLPNGGVPVPMPMPNGAVDGAPGMVNIPEPGLILVLKVADDSIEKMIEGAVGAVLQAPLAAVPAGNVTIKQAPMPLPLPVPVPLQPAMCRVGDYLVITSSPALAQKVVAVSSGQDSGLQGTPEFQKLAQGMDLNGNQFSYMSERVGEVYGQAIKQMLSSGPGNDLPPPVENLLIKAMTLSVSSAMAVTQVQPDGFVVQSHTTGMGYDTVALVGVTVVPVAVGAAFALPFMAAVQEEASEAATQQQMLNKARMVGTALIHHANVNGQLPNAETWTDDAMKIVGNADAFVNPMFIDPEAPNEKICVWLYNPNLSGVKLEDIDDKRNTVLMYDGGLEWNGVGGKESFMPEEFFKITTVFVDGHVEVIGPGEGGHVKWNP